MKNKFKVLFCTVLIIGCVGIFAGCGSEKVDLNQCVNYSFVGWDGYGEVTTDFDSSALENALGKDISLITYTDITKRIDGEWDTTNDLSNGDEINFKWNISKEDEKLIKKEYKIKLEYEDFTVTVEDLKDTSEFDVREGLEVKFTGVSPNGCASVKCNYEGLIATVDKASGLSNGDEIIITLEPEYLDGNLEDICKENDIPLIEETTLTYTVEGLNSYVVSAEDIPSEIMDIIDNTAVEMINELYQESECDTYDRGSFFVQYYKHYNFTNIELDKVYVKAAENNQPNKVYLIYKATYEDHGIQETYFSVDFTSITDSINGLTEEDIKDTAAYSVAGQYDYVENPETECKFAGMGEEKLQQYLDGKGVQR